MTMPAMALELSSRLNDLYRICVEKLRPRTWGRVVSQWVRVNTYLSPAKAQQPPRALLSSS